MKKTFLQILVAAVAVVMISSCQSTSNEIQLFNGKDLSNWAFYVDDPAVDPATIYMVKDGVIHIKGTPFGFMHTKEKYSDYTVKVEWRWVGEPSNSGIFLHVQDEKKCWPNAIECQLCADKAGDFVLLGGSDLAEFKVKEGEQRPAFPVVAKFTASNEKPAGEWNQAEIRCTADGTINVKINGVEQNKGTNSMHKSGYFGLQSEGLPIEFRNIVLIPNK